MLQDTVKKLALDKIERHIFLCADQTKPKCCDLEVGLQSWEYLKTRLKELGLEQPSTTNSSCIFRTKANCLRVCSDGPIIVVYPDGVWYRQATPEVIEEILQKHILGNQIVTEYAFLVHPLEKSAETSSSVT